MIASHVMLLIGLYQVILGRYSWTKIPDGTSVMKDGFYRFYLVEHPLMMITSVVLITLARRKAKDLNYRSVKILLLAALVLILAAIPWPFRENIGRAWFPGM
jgi:protein-S-isoprenylcysteine O-methyltransferase Ste14